MCVILYVFYHTPEFFFLRGGNFCGLFVGQNMEGAYKALVGLDFIIQVLKLRREKEKC